MQLATGANAPKNNEEMHKVLHVKVCSYGFMWLRPLQGLHSTGQDFFAGQGYHICVTLSVPCCPADLHVTKGRDGYVFALTAQ